MILKKIVFSTFNCMGFGIGLLLVSLISATLAYGIQEQLWLEVVFPNDVAFAYKIKSARNFGGDLKNTLRHVRLVPTDPEDACGQTIYNDKLLHGQVALIKRGGCSFVSKCLNVELSGAIAAVITDNSPHANDQWVEMVQDETNRVVGIPSYFLLGKDGQMISRSLKNHKTASAVINIPVNYTSHAFIHQPPWNLW